MRNYYFLEINFFDCANIVEATIILLILSIHFVLFNVPEVVFYPFSQISNSVRLIMSVDRTTFTNSFFKNL
jgi:hypothetical protein